MQNKEIIVKGVSLHLAAYIFLSLLLVLLGVPGNIVFTVFAVLLWGLFVLTYAYYNRA